MSAKKPQSVDLLVENRSRKANYSAKILHVTFPKRERLSIESLGGFLKLSSKTPTDKKHLSGQLIFPSPVEAIAALSTVLPDGVVLKRSVPLDYVANNVSLKVTGIPIDAGICEVAQLFPKSTTIMIKELRRVNFFIGSDKDYRNVAGKEAVVRFDNEEDCRTAFKSSAGSRIQGSNVVVMLGKRNTKRPKSERRKQRTIGRS